MYNLKLIKQFAFDQYKFFQSTGVKCLDRILLDISLSNLAIPSDFASYEKLEIYNPWLGPLGLVELNDAEAEGCYGKEAIDDFCRRVWNRISNYSFVTEDYYDQKNSKVSLQLDERTSLVATAYPEDDEANIYVFVEKDGCNSQDLVMVTADEHTYHVRLWEDENSDDFTSWSDISERNEE